MKNELISIFDVFETHMIEVMNEKFGQFKYEMNIEVEKKCNNTLHEQNQVLKNIIEIANSLILTNTRVDSCEETLEKHGEWLLLHEH